VAKILTPAASHSLLDLVLDKLVTSSAEARLDAEPEALIVDLDSI
jgi:hypothetical protein